MGNFNRNDNFSRGNSDREMFKATCADCGRECEIPFKPSNGRPVYCRDDFKKHSPEEGQGRDMNRGRDAGRGRDRGSRDNFRSGDREMFDSICANCGDKCRVPFQPREGKEVLCSNCFEKKGGDPRQASNNVSITQLNDIQAKLDRILELLSPAPKEKKVKSVDKVDVVKADEAVIEAVTEEVAVEEKPKAKKKTTKTA